MRNEGRKGDGNAMFRIAIADDESYIVQLIRQLIDCEGLNVQIVGDAADGRGALELVREKRPDILITDIRMPCMDGLELIEKIRESGIPTSVIAISGHRRFDYAYNALKYGVEDFIVKPINKKELNDAIAKALARLGGKKETSSQIEHLEKQATQNAARLRETLIEDCEKSAPIARSLEEINQAYLVRFVQGHFAGLAVRLDVPQALHADSPIVSKCRDTIDQTLKECAAEHVFVFSQQDSTFLGLVNTRPEQTGQLVRRVKKLFERLTVALDVYARISITIGIGMILSDPGEIGQSVRAAAMCVRIKCILGAQRIYYSEEYDRENLGASLNAAQTGALRALMEAGRPEDVAQWLQSVYAKPDAYYQEHPIEALALTDSAFDVFAALCKMQGIDLREEERVCGRADLERAVSFGEITRRLAAFFVRILEADRSLRLQRGNYPVERAKAYIAGHLGEPFRLEDISEAIDLSPSYLSNLFRKETGETISEYTQRLRLEKAKTLLRSTGMNINEIASAVGYADAKHFSKLFRKVIGAKPQDYRKMYSW